MAHRLSDAALLCCAACLLPASSCPCADGMFGPTSKEVAGTITTLNTLFCDTYPINQADAAAR